MNLPSVQLIGHGNGDLIQRIQDIQLRQRDLVRALGAAAVAAGHHVERADTARAARGRAVLSAGARSFSASSPNSSQVKGPSPTQEEYAFMMPMFRSILWFGMPAPTGA